MNRIPHLNSTILLLWCIALATAFVPSPPTRRPQRTQLWLAKSAWEQRWDDKYNAVVEFHERFRGHPVPYGMLFYENPRLADWVAIQKENLGLGVMRKDRLERLAKLGLTTKTAKPKRNAASIHDTPKTKAAKAETKTCSSSSSSLGKRWNDMYQKLLAFQKKNGHTRVDQSHDPKLADWVQIHGENLGLDVAREERRGGLSDSIDWDIDWDVGIDWDVDFQ